jgi:TRAP-type C4-dicarboxylate transport system permease large subunit
MLMVIPILQPILMAYGYDPVHFAMIILLTIVVASITPPVGMVLYLVCGIAKAKIEEVIKPVWLVVGVLLIAIIVMILFPGIITWLPNTFYK